MTDELKQAAKKVSLALHYIDHVQGGDEALALLVSAIEEREKPCKWKENGGHTGCGEYILGFAFSPEDTHVFCFGCGHPVEVVKEETDK